MIKSVCVAVSAVALVAFSVVAAEKAPDSFSNLMKANGAAMQSIGKAADSKDYDSIAKTAATLQANFQEIGKFWTARKDDEALKHCTAAFKASSDLAAAAKSMNDGGIAESRKALGSACAGCHTAKREKLPDGSFQIK
jgi:cytochrome c556